MMPPITADIRELTAAMPTGVQIVLAAVRPQVTVARTWAGMVLAGWGITPPARAGAASVLTELASNAVMHSGGHTFRIWLCTNRETSQLVIMAGDDSRLMPVPPPADPFAESGRGLRIVDALSERWGAYATATGKVVWSVLTLDP
jgi:hypothetical protein